MVKTRYFVARCKDLLIATDHKPLLGILNDKELDSIDNSRLVKLKQKMLAYKFSIVHVPGIKHKIADVTNRYPTGLANESRERWTRHKIRGNRTNRSEQDENETGSLTMRLKLN